MGVLERMAYETPGSLAVMNPLQVRESRAAFGLPAVYNPQVERALDIDIASLSRVMFPESQAAVAGPEGDSVQAMLVRPLSAYMRRGSRARVDHLDRAST
jgi:hypothetical protein